jgi:surfeit locus 1 family protein
VRIGNRNFSPKFWPSLATVLILPILVVLGFWQLDRADQKRSQYEILMRRQLEEAIDINRTGERINDKDKMLWRTVNASGHFNEDIQILLDNQVMNNQVGYFVFTPFALTGTGIWFLVNRGWVAVGNDRSQVPAFNRTEGTVSIAGTVMNAPVAGVSLGEIVDEQMAPGVYRLQVIDIAHVNTLIGVELMPYIIRLNPDSQYGYRRAWHRSESGENVHLAYAFQWFLLAVTLLLIYIVVNLEKDQGRINDE